jgi:hypothetical protein
MIDILFAMVMSNSSRLHSCWPRYHRRQHPLNRLFQRQSAGDRVIRQIAAWTESGGPERVLARDVCSTISRSIGRPTLPPHRRGSTGRTMPTTLCRAEFPRPGRIFPYPVSPPSFKRLFEAVPGTAGGAAVVATVDSRTAATSSGSISTLTYRTNSSPNFRRRCI